MKYYLHKNILITIENHKYVWHKGFTRVESPTMQSAIHAIDEIKDEKYENRNSFM